MATDSRTMKVSAKDLLSSLTAGKKPTKKVNAAATRPELALTPELETAFERFAGAKALLDLVEARETQEKDFLNDGCFQYWTERLWNQKNRPANPELRIEKDGKVDIQGIYQVQERYVFNAPVVPEDKTLEDCVIEEFVKLFTATGMSADDAQTNATNLVTQELTLTPKPIIDLDRLGTGHYEGDGKNKTFVEASAEEQAVASKLIRMLKERNPKNLATIGCFTDEEETLALEYKAQMVVKKGFLQRVCTYVNSLDQLRQVFSIIKPVKFPQAKKYADADSQDEKNRRLLAVACDILGIDVTEYIKYYGIFIRTM